MLEDDPLLGLGQLVAEEAGMETASVMERMAAGGKRSPLSRMLHHAIGGAAARLDHHGSLLQGGSKEKDKEKAEGHLLSVLGTEKAMLAWINDITLALLNTAMDPAMATNLRLAVMKEIHALQSMQALLGVRAQVVG